MVDLKGTEEPQGKVMSSQDEESDHSSAPDATSAEEPGEDEPVDIEINEPFDDEFQVSQH